VTVKGFKKCFISSAVDDTDVDKMENGSEENGSVRSECEDGDSNTDWYSLIESDALCALSV
jgi:hypothetical protein